MTSNPQLLSTRLALHLVLGALLQTGLPAFAMPSLDQAREAYQKGDYQGAQAIYRALIEQNPDHTTAWRELGRCHQQSGQPKEALRIWGNLLRLDPGDTRTLNARGDLHASLKEHPWAIRDFTRSLEKDPRQPAIRVRLGEAYEALEKWDQAAQCLDQALEDQTLADEARGDWTLKRARLDERQGQPQRAIQRLERLFTKGTEPSPDIRLALSRRYTEAGKASLERGQDAEALGHFEKAHALTPSDPGRALLLGEVALRLNEKTLFQRAAHTLMSAPDPEGEWAERLAERFIRAQKLDEGMAFFEKHPEPRFARSRSRLSAALGSRAYGQDQLDVAIEAFKKALRDNPDNEQALQDLGWCHARKGSWDEAQAIWSRYSKAFPQKSQGHVLLAMACRFQKDYTAAIQHADQALALEPGLKSARMHLLQALAQAGQWERARTVGADLGRDYPEDLAAQYRYAEVLTLMGEHLQAQKIWEKLRRLDGDNLRPFLTWLRVSYTLGDYASALAEATQAAQKAPAPQPVLSFLAQDAELAGDLSKAIHWHQRLCEDHPQRPEHWTGLVLSLKRSGAQEEALQVCERAMGHLPDQRDLQILRAKLALETGDVMGARARFQAISRQNAPNADVFQGWTQALMKTGDYEGALENLRSSFQEAFLSEADRRFWIADALAGQKKIQASLDVLESLAQDGPPPLPILLYHGIENQARTHSISSLQFERQMEALQRAGYTAIHLPELPDLQSGQKPWPKRPILITFDDARTDSFRQADPILEKLGLKATMFVPTGDSAPDADLFHASWQSLARHLQSGRWDLQGHGHRAHQPISLDAQGTQGKFLIDRAWLDELNRLEQEAEFQKRLDEDYALCKAHLLEKVPGSRPLAYAFPYNEAGQLSTGSAGEALSGNESAWKRHFRFGMMQDTRGYNICEPSQTQLLWRFEPLKTWNGEQLLSHLAAKHPRNEARLRLIQHQIWQGRTNEAARALDQLETAWPALKGEGQKVRLDLALACERPRQAEIHGKAFQAYRAFMAPPGAILPENHGLRLRLEQLQWANRPRVGVEGETRSGSDHRGSRSLGAFSTFPLQAPLDLTLRAGQTRFRERGLKDVSGPSIEGLLHWAPTQRFDLTAFLGGLHLQGLQGPGPETQLRWGTRFHYRYNRHDLRLEGSRDILESASALRAGLHQRALTFNYGFKMALWEFKTRLQSRTFSDGNHSESQDLQGLFTPAQLPQWSFGVNLQHADSRSASSHYYTPKDYRSALVKIRFQRTLPADSTLQIQASGGPSRDLLHASRWVGNASLHWINYWSRHLRSTLQAGGGTTEGYTSHHVSFSLEYRF